MLNQKRSSINSIGLHVKGDHGFCFSVAQRSWWLSLDFLLYLLNRSFRKNWQRAEQGGQQTLAVTHPAFLRKVALCRLLHTDGLQASSGSPARRSCRWTYCFQHCLVHLSLSMEPACSEQRSLQPHWTKLSLWRRIFIPLPAGRLLVHLGPTRLWGSCDGPGGFMSSPACGQHPGSLWAL